ncbi:MAG: 23S rRNA pseudouridine2605 synthase [Verrucomicrobiales bacterium]|jgi:23S rRNA pseudouridine2605 synthase
MSVEETAPKLPRLQKALAAAGVASRRVCEDMIEDGRITINGVVATLGDKVDSAVDELRVDGAIVSVDTTRRTVLLNKPVGVISTAEDTHGRPTVVELVGAEERLFPVGRLDADSEGLLLLTNDGGLTQRLTHPSYGVDKEYLVSVEGSPARGALRFLREGVDLDDGVTAPAKVSELSPGLLRIVLHEGRNRQIRRMCDAIGHPVTRLVRTRIGPLSDSTLAPGEWREVGVAEVRRIESAIAASAQLADEVPDEVE